MAFLKIKDVSGLTAATLGDSKTITVGQQVIAIGNALGEYQNSVTSGIVSGTGRSVTASDGTGYNTETLSDMIQTDAAINSGNSGGPLVNAAGEVIGINTATSTTAENMGFAIPMSTAQEILEDLMTGTSRTKQTEDYGYLGIYGEDVDSSTSQMYGIPEGVYITQVADGSPALAAGLLKGDIITAFDSNRFACHTSS